MSINANGLRTQQKRDMLGKLLLDLQVGVGLITETHLRKPDLSWVRYPQYHIVADYCRRTPAGSRIGGGALILVHRNFTTAKIPKIHSILPKIEHCSTKLYPTNDPETAIRLTAVYIPPPKVKLLKMEVLEKLNRPTTDPDTHSTLPHILGGDFNTTGWRRLYEEWLQKTGTMDLVNPQMPTYAGGTAIDKFLFVPGSYIPSTLLPETYWARNELDHCEDTPFYPAQVTPYTHLSDHLPILLPIPCDREEKPLMRLRRIRIGALSDETWQERDEQLGEMLEGKWPKSTLEMPIVNISRLFGTIQHIIYRTFHRESKPQKTKEETDPLERFIMSHLEHPDMDGLLEALEHQDTDRSERLIRRMSSDGWKLYLKKTNKNDTKALFAYLARSEGRKKWGFVPADSTPLIDTDGSLAINPQDKVRLVTKTFRARFSAAASNDPTLPTTDPNNVPIPPFRRPVRTPPQSVRKAEVLLALANLSEGRTPGPDGIPIDIPRRLPSLLPYIVISRATFL